jgi:hypothetical protein
MDNVPFGFALLCGGFFLIITLALGGGLIFFSKRSKKKADMSQGWPNVAGKVILSEVRESASTDDDGYTRYSYFPRVEYSYSVAGQHFDSKRLSFGGVTGTSSPDKAQETINKYPVGSPVTVYYNPENPSEGVIERVAGGSKLAMTMGIILLIISFFIACPLLIGVIRNFL